MLGLIRLFLGSLVALFRPRAALVAENLALRHQLGILLRSRPARLPLTSWGTEPSGPSPFSASPDGGRGWRHHQARDRHRVASPGVSTLLEEEVAGWATESACHSGEHELWSLGAVASGNSHCALTQSDISAVLDTGLIDEEPWRVFRPGAESCPDQLVEEEWSFPKKNPRTKGNVLPLSFWPAYSLGLQPGWLHAQGFLPSAQEVEQYFFPFTSTVASLQEQAPQIGRAHV